MIKPQELRIGNFVMTGLGSYEMVCGVLCDSVNTIGGTRLYDDIQPIHLSEGILEQCGFKKYDEQNKFWTFWVLPNNWNIGEAHHSEPSSGVKNGLFYWGENYTEVKYLHQLQNLFYALTGEDLCIKL